MRNRPKKLRHKANKTAEHTAKVSLKVMTLNIRDYTITTLTPLITKVMPDRIHIVL